MRLAKRTGLIMVLFSVAVACAEDLKPEIELARLKSLDAVARTEMFSNIKRDPTTASVGECNDRYRKQSAYFARCALALAESYPETPQAPQALAWACSKAEGRDNVAIKNAAYDLMARRYLDDDAILPILRAAWHNPMETTQAEAFLRASVERSSNLKVRGVACLSLGRHQQQLARYARMLDDDPAKAENMRKTYGMGTIEWMRSRQPEQLKAEAAALFERTIREFGDFQPTGAESATLGDLAEADLFKLRSLEIGRKAPEIDAGDIEGKPRKLSDYRGKVVVVSFWATWCASCMGMVPAEIALVEKMKGRPFALVGVNGDDDRENGMRAAAKAGMTWPSFWDGGKQKGTPRRWGVFSWPTIYPSTPTG